MISRIKRSLGALWRFHTLSKTQKTSLLRRRLPRFAGLVAGIRPPSAAGEQTPAVLSVREDPAEVYLGVVPHPTTGMGHRFAEWNTGFILSRRLGLPLLSTGLGGRWDAELGIRPLFGDIDEFIVSRRPRIVQLGYEEWHGVEGLADRLAERIALVRPARRPVIVMLADGQCLYNQSNYAAELKAAYWRVRQAPVATRGAVRVVVHVRRGDVAAMKENRSGNWQERFVAVDWFEAVLQNLLASLDGFQVRVEIVSQGSPEEFQPFARFGATLHLDEDAVESFHRMAGAGILITSPSSFSFTAALVGAGFRISKGPWWHQLPQSESWYVFDGDVAESTVGPSAFNWIQARQSNL